MSDISALDLIVAAVLALSVFIGGMRGLIRELLSIAIWIAAILGAFRYGSAVGVWLDLSAGIGPLAGFVAVFAAVFIVGALAKKLMASMVKAVGLGGVDRTLGLLFGGARGLLVCLVALVVARPFAIGQDWWAASEARPLLEAVEGEFMAWVADYPGRPEQEGGQPGMAPDQEPGGQDQPQPARQPDGITL